MNDVVCFVLNKDADLWPTYIQTLFENASSQKIRTEFDTVLFRSKSINSKSPAALTVVFASHGHLELLRENTGFNYRTFVTDQGNAILFLLGVDEDDLNVRGADQQPISSRFSNFSAWKKFDHEHPVEMVRFIEHHLKSIKNKKPLPSQPRSFKLVPNVARCESPTVITIFFDEPLTSAAKVEALITDDESGRLTIVIPAEYKNPYSFTCVAPEHRECQTDVRVMVDGKLAGSSQLKFVSDVEKYSALSQIYVHQLSQLCGLLAKHKVPTADVDNCLSGIFDPDSSVESVIPIEAFELMFGIYRYCLNDSSDVELPTMLHFAAKHGLQELTAKLTDLPDASLAHAIRNSEKKMPEELARKYKHSSLTLFLENFREVNEGFDDLYVKCHGYVNAYGPANSGDLSGYLRTRSHLLESTGKSDYVVLYPPADGGGAAEEADDEIYYMYVSSNTRASTAGEANTSQLPTASSATKKPNPKVPSTQSATARAPSLSGDQRQLVEIMEMYKNKKYSIAEVEALFRQWKLQCQSASNVKSFRDKQETLKKMKEDVVKARTHGNISAYQTKQHSRDGAPELPPRTK